MSDRVPADTADTLTDDAALDEGTRYPDTVKDLAYQLWAFELGGNAEKVSVALAQQSPPVVIDGRRVRDWAMRYQWAIRRYKDWYSIAPDVLRTTAIDLQFGIMETAAEMRRLLKSDKTSTVTTISRQGSTRIEEKPEVSVSDRIAAGRWIGENYARLRELGLTTQQAPERDTGDQATDTALTSDEAYRRIMARRERWGEN